MRPTITKREAQPYAGIRHALEREKLSEFVPGRLSTAFGFLQNGADPLITLVQYVDGVLMIRFFGSHEEYDGIDAETV